VISLATMIARLEGLLGTADLSDWEQGFVRNVAARTAAQRRAGQPLDLTPGQVEKIDDLHERHFAG